MQCLLEVVSVQCLFDRGYMLASRYQLGTERRFQVRVCSGFFFLSVFLSSTSTEPHTTPHLPIIQIGRAHV